MYSRLADKLSNILVRLAEKENKNNINKNVEVISYGVELLLSSVVNLILVFAIGAYLFGVHETFIFIVLFCPIRQFSGGFHANSYLKCTVGFLVLFIAIGSLFYIVNNNWHYFIICLACIIYIGIVSPIDTENKRMNQKLRDKCKKKVVIILGIEFVSIVTFLVLAQSSFMWAATMAMLIESVLLAAGDIVNRKGSDSNVNCSL